MSKTARLYRDTRTANAAGGSGLDRLNDDLQDVTRIMTKNMEELLWRGDSLDRPSLFRVVTCASAYSRTNRNVPSVDVSTVGIREISKSSEEYQHQRHDTSVRAFGRDSLHRHHTLVVEILVNHWTSGYCVLSLYSRSLFYGFFAKDS